MPLSIVAALIALGCAPTVVSAPQVGPIALEYSAFAVDGRPDLRMIVYNPATPADRKLIASLVDCHSTGTAAAAMYRAEGRAMDTLPPFRFVTGSLHVDYLKPTPLEGELELRGRVKEIKGRKVVVETTVLAGGVATARGEVVAVQMPESFGAARA